MNSSIKEIDNASRARRREAGRQRQCALSSRQRKRCLLLALLNQCQRFRVRRAGLDTPLLPRIPRQEVCSVCAHTCFRTEDVEDGAPQLAPWSAALSCLSDRRTIAIAEQPRRKPKLCKTCFVQSLLASWEDVKANIKAEIAAAKRDITMSKPLPAQLSACVAALECATARR